MNDEINVAEAAIIVKSLPKARQAEIYHATRNDKPTFKTVAGNAVLAERAKLLTATCAALPKLAALVVHIDPPYAANQESPFNYRDTAYRYPVMPNEEIGNILSKVSAPNCWVFVWTPPNHRDDAKAILRAVGCEIDEEIIWNKTINGKKITFGKGRVVRHTHEILLIARRGNSPLPPTDSVPRSVIEADVEEHSKKPDVFRDLIIRMTPNLEPRVELFARGQPYPGFVAWGNEVTQHRETAIKFERQASSETQPRRKAA
jgi:N6-adenosine-specific RNA methylase IME4